MSSALHASQRTGPTSQQDDSQHQGDDDFMPPASGAGSDADGQTRPSQTVPSQVFESKALKNPLAGFQQAGYVSLDARSEIHVTPPSSMPVHARTLS